MPNDIDDGVLRLAHAGAQMQAVELFEVHHLAVRAEFPTRPAPPLASYDHPAAAAQRAGLRRHRSDPRGDFAAANPESAGRGAQAGAVAWFSADMWRQPAALPPVLARQPVPPSESCTPPRRSR